MKFITENGGKVEAHIRKINQKDYRAEIKQFVGKNKDAIIITVGLLKPLKVSLKFKIPNKNKLSIDINATTSGEYLPQTNKTIVTTNINKKNKLRQHSPSSKKLQISLPLKSSTVFPSLIKSLKFDDCLLVAIGRKWTAAAESLT